MTDLGNEGTPSADAMPAPSGAPVGWYQDPGNAAFMRYWDGRQWTAHVHPVEAGDVAAAPADLGPSNAAHWMIPVGRSGWSIAAGYMGLFSLVFGIFGPLGLVFGIATLAVSWRALVAARAGGHGMGRVVTGFVGGSIAVAIGALTTFFYFLSG